MGSSSLACVGVNLSHHRRMSVTLSSGPGCVLTGVPEASLGRRETQDSGDSGQRLRVKRALGCGCPGGPGPGAAGNAHPTGAWKTRATLIAPSSRKPPKVPAADLHEEAWLRRSTRPALLASPPESGPVTGIPLLPSQCGPSRNARGGRGCGLNRTVGEGPEAVAPDPDRVMMQQQWTAAPSPLARPVLQREWAGLRAIGTPGPWRGQLGCS